MTKYPKCATVAALLLGFAFAWTIQEKRMEQKEKDAEIVRNVGKLYKAQMKNLRGE